MVRFARFYPAAPAFILFVAADLPIHVGPIARRAGAGRRRLGRCWARARWMPAESRSAGVWRHGDVLQRHVFFADEQLARAQPNETHGAGWGEPSRPTA